MKLEPIKKFFQRRGSTSADSCSDAPPGSGGGVSGGGGGVSGGGGTNSPLGKLGGYVVSSFGLQQQQQQPPPPTDRRPHSARGASSDRPPRPRAASASASPQAMPPRADAAEGDAAAAAATATTASAGDSGAGAGEGEALRPIFSGASIPQDLCFEKADEAGGAGHSPVNASGRFARDQEASLAEGAGASSQWAVAFLVVQFDLEAGQVIEKVVPEGAVTAEQQREICQMSFPDSNSHLTFDTCYVVKPKRRDGKRFNYGYVYFRQKRDPSLPRGYIQQSLVLLSRWPFVSLMEQVVRSVAARYFEMCPVSPTPALQTVSTATSLSCSVSIGTEPPLHPTLSSSVQSSTYPLSPLSYPASLRPHQAPPAAPAGAAAHGAVCAALAAAAEAVVEAAPDGALLPRYQLLLDVLLDVATWAHPEACRRYVFPFMGGHIVWQAPKFWVTSRVWVTFLFPSFLLNFFLKPHNTQR